MRRVGFLIGFVAAAASLALVPAARSEPSPS